MLKIFNKKIFYVATFIQPIKGSVAYRRVSTQNEDTGKTPNEHGKRACSCSVILTNKFSNTPGHQTTLGSRHSQNNRHKMPC